MQVTGSGFGYVTGQGGAVTQATSKSTGVTLSKVCGEITMNAAALASGGIISFTCTNTTADPQDGVIVNHVSGGTLAAYNINARAGTNQIIFDVRNNTGGSLSEAIVLRFVIIKAVNA